MSSEFREQDEILQDVIQRNIMPTSLQVVSHVTHMSSKQVQSGKKSFPNLDVTRNTNGMGGMQKKRDVILNPWGG